MAYTTSDLLTAIERRSFAPANQLTFTTTDILQLADEELQSVLMPRIMSVREEYYVTYKDYAVVGLQNAYDIPPRSIASLLREAKLLNSGGTLINLTRIEPENINTTNGSSPESFYLESDSLVLYPTPSAGIGGLTLRLHFFASPGSLIETSDAAVISAIDTVTNVVSVSTIPSSWNTGDTFDFISGKGSQSYRGIDFTSTLVSGTDITFSSLPDKIAVGDYLSIAETSPLVQLPQNMRAVLAQATAARILAAQNQPGASEASEKTEMLLEAAINILTPRVQGEQRVLLPDNWF
jgi:hypothetical protein